MTLGGGTPAVGVLLSLSLKTHKATTLWRRLSHWIITTAHRGEKTKYSEYFSSNRLRNFTRQKSIWLLTQVSHRVQVQPIQQVRNPQTKKVKLKDEHRMAECRSGPERSKRTLYSQDWLSFVFLMSCNGHGRESKVREDRHCLSNVIPTVSVYTHTHTQQAGGHFLLCHRWNSLELSTASLCLMENTFMVLENDAAFSASTAWLFDIYVLLLCSLDLVNVVEHVCYDVFHYSTYSLTKPMKILIMFFMMREK